MSMKVTICSDGRHSQSGNPTVHKAGCGDIRRAIARRELADPFDVEVASETEATLAYWDNGIIDETYGYEGARYATRDDAVEAFRRNYMHFAPCVKLPEKVQENSESGVAQTADPRYTSVVGVERTPEEEGEKDVTTPTPTKPSTRGRKSTATTTTDVPDAQAAKDASVISGVTAADVQDAPPKPPVRTARKGTKAAKTTQPKADADAPKPPKVQAEKRTAKQDLARTVVEAIAKALEGKSDEEKMTVSRWIHHLPTGTVNGTGSPRFWPEGLPRPDRSDWK